MDKNREIEEMARVMNECCNRYDEQGNHIGNKCYECECWCDTNHICCSYNTKEALALYNAGYRKSSEVAEEIFAEIEKTITDLEYRTNTLRKTVKVEELKAQVNWVLHEVVPKTLAELKNKYTEGEG